jgi:hypothetical protein
MSLHRPNEIREVEFPGEFLPALHDISTLCVESIHRDGAPIETGEFDLRTVSESVSTALFFLKWVSSTNQIIGNLNIVIADMRALPIMFRAMAGMPHDRFYLLVLTYFHEFYRFRELYGRTIKVAAHRDYIQSRYVKTARQEFHDAFGPTIELRNSLVHGSPIWSGKRHFDLQFIGGAWEVGRELRDKETGQIWEMRDVLQEICQHTADAFRDEGNRMSSVKEKLVKAYVSLAQNSA